MNFTLLSLAIVAILLLISSAWMLNNFDKLVNAIKAKPDCIVTCNVDKDSITNGRNYAIFTLLVSIVLLLVTGWLLYSDFSKQMNIKVL